LQGRILVVEDHPVNQKVLAHQLHEMGLQYAVASSGSQALDLLAKEAFDLVLMDCQMPVMDGYETTRRIRQLPTDARRIPVIALTAHAGSDFRDVCIAAGGNDYLSKPYTEAALAALLTQWLPQAGDDTGQPTLLDLPALHARYPGKPDLVEELVAVFNSTTAASLEKLRSGIEQGDVEACRKEAHALKGAAASVRATAIQEGAARLEACLDRGDLASASTELDAMENTFRERA
jgi:CheY-like chemotaxis protein/HPt (histidine-containing phosphotransfer) domain-containing protein